ncbi:hypothetical protein FOZ63_009929 [Perkinsus olseni]|uniref:Uncharacterized protein n=2 Tax=Perkinsus olseni TaxID=32597 RepID=A0A7J6QU48_PEROL|nr:hypothetical protein FOZ63_009929 [Perkinsus olseni]
MDLNRTATELRVKHEKSIEAAHRGHGYKLDFSAYTLGHDVQYLGLNGKIQYGKPYANDSSNMQAVINAPAYWSRVYYRGSIKDDTKETPDLGASKLGKSRSEAALKEADDSGGYGVIKARMKDFVQSYNKPALVWAPTSSKHTGERISEVDNGRLTFHNTLSHLKVTTFNDKGSALGAPGLISSRSCVDLFAGGRGGRYCQETHRSRPSEVAHISSLYYRRDRDLVKPLGCSS